MSESHMSYAKLNKPDSKGYILYFALYDILEKVTLQGQQD